MPGRPEIKPIAIDPVSHSPPFPRSTLDHGFYLCHREEKSCGFPTNGRVPLTVNGEYLTRSVVPLLLVCLFSSVIQICIYESSFTYSAVAEEHHRNQQQLLAIYPHIVVCLGKEVP